MRTDAPLHWVKYIQEALIETKALPVSKFAPLFPWEMLSEKIGSLLQTPDVKISARKTQFLSGEAISSGLGANPICIALELTPLGGQAFWMMAKEDVAKLSALALLHSAGHKGFSSMKFQEGFYYFLATQIVAVMDELQAFGDLSVKIGKFNSLPQEEALCIDVDIHHPKTHLWGRLVCPAAFHHTFKTHFSTQPPPPLTSALAEQIDVTLRLEVGRTSLPLSRWEAVSVGDFILLDRCSFDPETLKGTMTLFLDQTPLLRARLKESSIKIVDYAFYHEEPTPMSSPDEEGSEFSSSEEMENEENPLWSSQNGNEEHLSSEQETWIVLTVEVARLRINLDKLLQLTPGNVLELPVKPEQGVDVTVEGKKVAQAELVKLGELIGIKILQIGK